MNTAAPSTILVVGATGTVGRDLVRLLRRDGHKVRALTRDPAKAATLLGEDVELVGGDLRDPATLATALRSVDAASLATTSSPSLSVEEGNFIGAAVAAGVRRVVKLSAFGIDFASDPVHRGHADSERRLRASGIPFVILRPNVFMSNLLMDLHAIVEGRLPSVFGDARVSFVDPHDVAELMAVAIVQPRYEGETWEFGGPEALSYDELAGRLTQGLGFPVEHFRMDHTTFAAAATGGGIPDFVVQAIMHAAADAREGRYVTSDDVVQRVLGRRAAPLDHWLGRNRHSFDIVRSA